MKFDIMPVATEKQLYEIYETAVNVWHNYYKGIFSSEQISYMLEFYQSVDAMRKQIAKGYIYYMLLADNELAGYLCIKLVNDHVFLERLYVKEEYRRQGLAKKTLSHIESIFKKPELGYNHVKKIRLRVEKENRMAQDIYEHLGFNRIREENDDIGKGFVCRNYLMERRIGKDAGDGHGE